MQHEYIITVAERAQCAATEENKQIQKKTPANYENIIGNNVLQILTMQPNTETRYKN